MVPFRPVLLWQRISKDWDRPMLDMENHLHLSHFLVENVRHIYRCALKGWRRNTKMRFSFVRACIQTCPEIIEWILGCSASLFCFAHVFCRHLVDCLSGPSMNNEKRYSFNCNSS